MQPLSLSDAALELILACCLFLPASILADSYLDDFACMSFVAMATEEGIRPRSHIWGVAEGVTQRTCGQSLSAGVCFSFPLQSPCQMPSPGQAWPSLSFPGDCWWFCKLPSTHPPIRGRSGLRARFCWVWWFEGPLPLWGPRPLLPTSVIPYSGSERAVQCLERTSVVGLGRPVSSVTLSLRPQLPHLQWSSGSLLCCISCIFTT